MRSFFKKIINHFILNNKIKMSVIKPLDQSTIKLLKCTQVITSIYSVVKELVENSLDANANNIEVCLVNGGLTLIEVKDNGCGIAEKDAQYMGLPSYTSKLSDFNELDCVSTYGFRGEGLNAICQVSDVVVNTKTDKDETMFCYKLDHDGFIATTNRSHGLTGTMVQARNLFKNIPVRRSVFSNTRTLNQDLKKIEHLIKAYAICLPKVKFTLKIDGKSLISKPSCRDFEEAAEIVIGIQVSEKLKCLKNTTPLVSIVLIIPHKNVKSSKDVTRNLQFLCVNGRPIKSKEIEKLINKRINDYLNPDSTGNPKYIWCLFLTVTNDMLDVNLEPNKDKIMFHNENLILDEIDNLILTYYSVQSSQNSNSENMDKLNLNEEQEDRHIPKKRKIDHESETIKQEIVCEPILNDDDFLKSLKSPDLSEPESTNEENETKADQTLNGLDQESPEIELINFNKTIISSQESPNDELINNNKTIISSLPDDKLIEVDETISNPHPSTEIPVVDLGEDFDMAEIYEKQRLHKYVEEEASEKKAQQNDKNDILAWSKGQISGIENGIQLTPHSPQQQNNRMDSEPFDYPLVAVKKNMKCTIDQDYGSEKTTSRSNNLDINKFAWKDNQTSEKNCIVSQEESKTPKNEKKECALLRSVSKKTTKKEKKSTNSQSSTSTQLQSPFGGDFEDLNVNSVSTFATFCNTIRPEIVAEKPELNNAEVAAFLQKRWKSLSSEERGYYRDLTKQNLQNSFSRSFKRSVNDVSQAEVAFNKKKFTELLDNMKTVKKNEGTMAMKHCVSWDLNIDMVKKKFRKCEIKKIENFVVGSPDSDLWIFNWNSKLNVCDIKKIFKRLGLQPENPDKMNADLVEQILTQWVSEEREFYYFYKLIDKNKLVD